MDVVDILVSFHINQNPHFNELKEFFLLKEKLTARAFDFRIRCKGKVSMLFDTPSLIKIISRPDILVVLLSTDYLNDKWLVEELRALYSIEQYLKKQLIIPILLGEIKDSDIPFYFKENLNTIIDNRQDSRISFDQLFSIIESHTGPRKKIFIGHGRSLLWTVLRDFLKGENLECDEFNNVPTPGGTIKERLEEMLTDAQFAFLVMTAEDEHSDGTKHARENVIHEVGLFQGKLGFKKAIILLEFGCEIPSNASGIVYISFPKGNITACFQEVKEVLMREKITMR